MANDSILGTRVGAVKTGAVSNDAHQGGDKAAPRAGANKGVVDHHMVDKIDHAGTSKRVKKALGAEGHHNVTYHNGGEM